ETIDHPNVAGSAVSDGDPPIWEFFQKPGSVPPKTLVYGYVVTLRRQDSSMIGAICLTPGVVAGPVLHLLPRVAARWHDLAASSRPQVAEGRDERGPPPFC